MNGKDRAGLASDGAEKNGYAHFMLKEMFEQPGALRATLDASLAWDMSALPSGRGDVRRLERIVIVGMGTARHAGLFGKAVLQQLAGIPVEVELSSEFRDGDALLPPETLVIAVSQSGETADTLAAIREAQHRGLPVLAVTNVEGSSLAREADGVLYTWAGPERAVPSTKAYLAQLGALAALALQMGKVRGHLSPEDARRWEGQLRALPEVVGSVLERQGEIEPVAERLTDRGHVFFVGRGLDLATAMEGALKLKEVSYIHAEAYAAGEFRHGSLALLQEGDPVIGVATQPRCAERMAGNVREVAHRGGWVWLVATPDVAAGNDPSLPSFLLPPVAPLLAPVVSVVPLQFLAYHTARLRGCEIDTPRNLSKSVTVE